MLVATRWSHHAGKRQAFPTSATVISFSTETSPVGTSTATPTPIMPISQNGGRGSRSFVCLVWPVPTTSPRPGPNHASMISFGVLFAPSPLRVSSSQLQPSAGVPHDSDAMLNSLSMSSRQARWTLSPTTTVVRLGPLVGRSVGVRFVSLRRARGRYLVPLLRSGREPCGFLGPFRSCRSRRSVNRPQACERWQRTLDLRQRPKRHRRYRFRTASFLWKAAASMHLAAVGGFHLDRRRAGAIRARRPRLDGGGCAGGFRRD